MFREPDASDASVLRALFLDEVGGYLDGVTAATDALAHAARRSETLPRTELDALFRALHTLKGAAASVGHEAIAQAAHDLEDVCSELRQERLLLTPGILDRIEDELRGLRALVTGARRRAMAAAESAPAGLPAPVVDRRQGAGRRIVGDRRARGGTVPVETGTLDRLQERAGDLVIARTRLERRTLELAALRESLSEVAAHDPGASAFLRSADRRLGEILDGLGDEARELRRIGEALDASVRAARLQPLEGIYHRLAAALREIEGGSGRAQLITSGGALELDKGVLERLYPPLLHLLRNAIAHGIEPAELRRRAGKPEQGRIEVTVRIENDFVFLTFSDDGAGVDRERARAALVAQGRLAPDAPLDDERLVSALFEVGFSTRTEVDALAGRGMGLDVVRSTVVELGGDVRCETARGQGTRFDISFPLTTAITEALLLKVGGQVYALPRAYLAAQEDAPTEQPPARLSLPLLFGTAATAAPETVRARWGPRRFDLECDRVIGLRTIVVRPLGPLLGRIPCFAGATVSGAGKAQLVLNARTLAAWAG